MCDEVAQCRYDWAVACLAATPQLMASSRGRLHFSMATPHSFPNTTIPSVLSVAVLDNDPRRDLHSWSEQNIVNPGLSLSTVLSFGIGPLIYDSFTRSTLVEPKLADQIPDRAACSAKLKRRSHGRYTLAMRSTLSLFRYGAYLTVLFWDETRIVYGFPL